ncbi:HD domain-containing protein [Latilactobacillus curvatus]|uniref:HD domain-containing protein n=1 Tax=Latilactobacillus curvatus TaxID=28038 RepID=A0A385AEW7_LATCU|nr:HD domain-containing protein [Latilactobacillus curvatus]AXN36242.1 HD domain-containing protein [Latilactobacillus curvatus]AZP96028.1 HD domain-containing protein [Latilactobacillus curvatus]MCP8847927.1 HD domain-containing protein [Latilactobacillus curvatus]MCP8861294.1 HD domain-containing protein [Latilactobacillus curvatus]MCP8862658.1 HD domain-containing protein [Latilactobacillus curvatus]
MTAKKLFDYQNDENLDLFVLIKTADVRIAKNGKQFIAFTFQDQSGQIGGKYWDASDEDVAKFTAGQVIHLQGKRELYQNNPQVKIYKLRLTTGDEPQTVDQFIPKAPVQVTEMQDEFGAMLFEITNPNWQRLVRHLMQKHQAEFFSFPAAKTNHHAFSGGLAYHTLSMLRLAKTIAAQYPQIDEALLYAGVILHDLGKTLELSGPISTEYTVRGNLIGHIVLVDEEIVRACDTLKIDVNAEDMLLLRHVILAHHGLMEYGSPVRPQVLEAEVLHQIDELDASITMMTQSLQHAEAGQFTERLFAMDGRRFYRPVEDPNLDQPTE